MSFLKILYFFPSGKVFSETFLIFLMFFRKMPMFHVEHSMFGPFLWDFRDSMRLILLFFMAISVSACNKPNPNPELTDEIYNDLQSQASNAQREMEAEKKHLEELKKDVDTATPQMGSIKFAQKRYFEGESRIRELEQKMKYYSLKAESRLHSDRIEYRKAFRDGKPWPSPEEIEAYKKYKELSKVEPQWSAKKRIADYDKANGISNTPAGEAGKGEKKEESPKKE